MAQISCKNLWKVYGPGNGSPAGISFDPGRMPPTSDDLSKAGCFAAVADVSLEVENGEILVIMGLSGSGKSTLLRCLCRLIEPTAGKVRIGELDLLSASQAEMIELRRKRIGMVFQHFGLLPHRTVLGNILLPLEVQGADRLESRRKAQQVIELVGLSGRDDRYPFQLSGGQQQRVGIARSLISDPEIWFLDEPFSALDPLIRREMQDEFLRLQRQLRKTIVFVTHDFDEAMRVADRICIMKDGRIVQNATPEDLLLRPADDYVRRFTGKANMASVIRLDALGLPLREGVTPARNVLARATVAEVAEEVL